MPEGHSIHRLARQFGSAFAGQELRASSPQGRFSDGARLLDGHMLVGASAHGKQLFLHFDHDLHLRVHLGLYGAWEFGGDETFVGASSIGAPRRMGEQESGPVAGTGYAGAPEPVGAVRVRLESPHGWADLRGASACEVVTSSQMSAVTRRLGPDPLHDDDGAAAGEFIRRLGGKSAGVGQLLMNQEIIAGVGNVYRAEVLFLRRLDPRTPGRSIPEAEALALWETVRSCMSDGVREGRIVTTRPVDRDNPEGPASREDAHYVYKRTGLPCRRCGTPIAQAELAARKLYWCPSCQRGPAHS